MVKFNSGKADALLIGKIVDRYQQWLEANDEQEDRMDLMMDVTAVHCNGNPLRLDDLLAADDFNFVHDLAGITRHIDRTTGQLLNCFSPRYSARQAEAA